ncbi:ABC transporter permease [Kordiimonas aquimaris]|uniref:ABC transporter permease n=1 Tax=Kordiimonas aquimaris TaxID=707591 RepID=UPI0021CF7803|nr:MlaE family lipid ABC transporter permease subunit [Kordiimonas aquimaris]
MVDAAIIDEFVTFEKVDTQTRVTLKGNWIIDNAILIDTVTKEIFSRLGGSCETGRALAQTDMMRLDCSGLQKLDTTGAVLVRRFAAHMGEDCEATLMGVPEQNKALLDVITCCPVPAPTEPERPPWYLGPLIETGESVFLAVRSLGRLLSFLGLVLVRLFGSVSEPGRVRLVPVIHQMEVTGLRAMGIVGLISFLIGAVMVNQGAIQLAKFGADIFVIDMLGISHLRELGILLTAIIVAGRSGSAFTAQIGSMVLREEVDAMKTLGMNPIDVLVLPRLIALLICLPLLGFYADIVGVAGGIMMAWIQLDISPANFVVYFRDVITVEHYWVGILKAPFFAAVIATCGCYQGLRVEGSADALGMRTTKSVVQSIFLVIAFDALFAIFFTSIGM